MQCGGWLVCVCGGWLVCAVWWVVSVCSVVGG